MSRDRRIKLVIFDIDGTLYSSMFYEAVLEREIVGLISERLAVSREEAGRLLRAAKRKRMTVSFSLGELGLDRRDFYRDLACRVDPTQYISPKPILREYLSTLKRLGVRVAAHTNSGRDLALKVLASLGLEESDFEVVVTSDDAEPKPSPGGYESILTRMGCKAEESVYVGDRPVVELRTAKLMGMKTIQVGGRPSEWMDLHAVDIDHAFKILLRLVRDLGEE